MIDQVLCRWSHGGVRLSALVIWVQHNVVVKGDDFENPDAGGGGESARSCPPEDF